MAIYDIVIVNWNSGDYLEKCVKSIINSNTEDGLGKIIVIDNASTDNSFKSIEHLKQVKTITNTNNKGFAAACNQGINASNTPYVVMINPDVEVFKNTLAESVRFMEQNPKIDIMGCMQLNEAGKTVPSCARFPTPFRFFYDSTGLSKLLPKIFRPATLMTDWDHQESKQVDQIIGSYMFIRKCTLDKIGLFDERFFVYYEELDLSKRLKDAGGLSYYNHNIKLLHYGEGTTKGVKAFRLFLNLNSRLIYSSKHFKKPGHVFTIFVTLVIEPFSRSVFSLVKGDYKSVTGIWRGYFLVLKNMLGFKP